MTDVTLHPANPSDEALILEMASAFHLEDGHPLHASSPEAIRALLGASPLGQLYLLRQGESTVGYCALCYTMSIEFGGVVMILDDLYVRPEFRGRGIGSAVLKEIEGRARRENNVQLFLEVEDQNHGARRLYERYGFSVRRRQMMEKLL